MKLPNPSVNKKFIIIAIIVVVLGGVGFWAFLFLSGTPEEEGAVISKKIAIPMAEPPKGEITPAPPPEEVKPKEVKTAKIKPEAPKPSVKKEEAFELEEEEAPPSVKKAERKAYKPWGINLASFKSKKEANEFRNSLSQKGYNAYVTDFVKNGNEWHRVRVGFYETEAKANKVADELSKKFPIGAPWVVKPSRGEIEKHSN